MDKQSGSSLIRNTGLRYFLVSLCALGGDYVLTLSLFHTTHLSLTSAAAVSFILVGFVFYFVHEFWTFRSAESRVSHHRLLGNLAVLLLAGLVRVILIFLLESWKAPVGILASIYFAIGVTGSFTTNFVLNRFLVFRR